MAPDRPVYVIDDDGAVRESLSCLLKTAGMQRRVFATGEEFLTELKGEEPICALVDVFLPGMDGLTLQQRLADRGIEAGLIFMTGQADVPMAVEAMRAGALHFIEKPFDPENILEAVSDAMIRLNELMQAARQSVRKLRQACGGSHAASGKFSRFLSKVIQTK